MNTETDNPNAFSDCPDWGTGGSFVFDPKTGKRTRVTPPEEGVEQLAALEAPAAATSETQAEAKPAVDKKEKGRG